LRRVFSPFFPSNVGKFSLSFKTPRFRSIAKYGFKQTFLDRFFFFFHSPLFSDVFTRWRLFFVALSLIINIAVFQSVGNGFDIFTPNVKARPGTANLSDCGASVRQAFPPTPHFRSFFSQILPQYSIISTFPNLTIFFLLF
jgi:hypothetical protein